MSEQNKQKFHTAGIVDPLPAMERAILRPGEHWLQDEAVARTPAATWRSNGEPDPHGDYYDRERAALPMGKLTDDELANGAFMNYDHRPSLEDLLAGKGFMPIVWMTAVKDRIRWLSRALVKAQAASAALVQQPQGEAEPIGYINPDDLAKPITTVALRRFRNSLCGISMPVYAAPPQAAPAALDIARWIRVDGDHLIISRCDWVYPNAAEDDAGQRDERRYDAIDRNDGCIALSFKGAHVDAKHFAVMLAYPSAAPVAQGLDVDAVMTKIQEFASTWSVVGGRFDDGTAMERAEECKAEIRAILAQAAHSAHEKCRTCGHASHPWTSCVNVAPSASAQQAKPAAWCITMATARALAAELVRGAESMGDDESELILEVRRPGTVEDDDGKTNERHILAISLAEYPEEGVYPIDPADPTGGRVDAAPTASPAALSDRRCQQCNAPRKGDECHKCGAPTVEPCAGWEEPALPPIDRIRELAREVGYAIGVHGTLERDLDLIAAPWSEEAATLNYREVMLHIADGLGARLVEVEGKPLGRRACTIQMDGWYKPIDLSVCPTLAASPADQVGDAHRFVLLTESMLAYGHDDPMTVQQLRLQKALQMVSEQRLTLDDVRGIVDAAMSARKEGA